MRLKLYQLLYRVLLYVLDMQGIRKGNGIHPRPCIKGGSLGGYAIRISAIFLRCFRKSADGNWLFPLLLRVMSKVFLLHIKHNINHFLSILHVTDQTQAVAVIVGDYFARKILLLLLLLCLLSSDLCDMYHFRLF